MLVLRNRSINPIRLIIFKDRRGRGKIEDSKNIGSGVLFGLIIVFVLAIVCSLIISLILTFTSLQESSVQFVVTAVSFVSLFIGGFVSGGKGKQKGWMLGGLTGLSYSLIIFLFQYLGHDSLFNLQQIIYHVCYILTAMMGGILGVNMTNKSRAA
ncbi:putative membrane protein (TIGR04086 family) [Cytobacillus eiseniae]|uniref:Membrane protein (TIGR04086 family) n=1 Tax=Cytobacillus eiseniae TaxID=762947 RepID=A0ABS4RE18_9BACI|nr:TIGR04086 family membrane protein [Cytobacillus eiseniae]MBP2240554.1 putative membrane protein (TIGR04086 family) [Cytobacillus eiseniae]